MTTTIPSLLVFVGFLVSKKKNQNPKKSTKTKQRKKRQSNNTKQTIVMIMKMKDDIPLVHVLPPVPSRTMVEATMPELLNLY